MMQQYIPPFLWHYLTIPVDSSNSLVFRRFNAQFYDELLHQWRWINPAQDSVLSTPLKGYGLFSSNTVIDSLILGFEGKLITGTRTLPLTRTWNPNLVPPAYDGWNLVGNPFPSGADWESNGWILNNVDPVAYFFNGSTYLPYNRNNHLGNGSRFMAPAQGFFVHVTNGNAGLISVDNSARVHANQVFLKDYPEDPDLLIVSVEGNNYQDETWITFDSLSSAGFDPASDAYKLFGISAAPQVYCILPDTLASIDVLPGLGYNTIVPVGFKAGVQGTYILTAGNTGSFGTIYPIFLEDLKTNSWQNLMTDSVYYFSATPFDDPARFRIHFNYSYQLVSGRPSVQDVYIYSYNECVVVRRQKAWDYPAVISLYDLSGRLVFQRNLKRDAENLIFPGVSEGCYVVVVTSEFLPVIRKIILGKGG
jgi:hypothetical protein